MQLFKQYRSFLVIIVGCFFLFNTASYALEGISFSEDTSVASGEGEDLWANLLKVLIPGAALAIG